MFFSLQERYTHCQTTLIETRHVLLNYPSVGAGGGWKIIVWHYKETNKNSLLKLLYVITDISAPFGGPENCFHNECGSQGNERDIWMWEHVEGSPQCTEVTERSPWATESFMSVLKDVTLIRQQWHPKICADQGIVVQICSAVIDLPLLSARYLSVMSDVILWLQLHQTFLYFGTFHLICNFGCNWYISTLKSQCISGFIQLFRRYGELLL